MTFDRRDARARVVGYVALALLAYVPPLRSSPGMVSADTKQYLYLDPGRVLARASSMWDPNIGFGTVTHQNIGYLFPLGPYYWSMDRLGVPDWVAQRLWLGSLIFAAGLGVLHLMRRLGRVGPGVVVAAIAYMATPYVVEYSARLSVLLMPWAALGFLIAFVVDAARDGDWRRPALFALTVQVVGGVNATALVFALVGPILWLLVAVVVERRVTVRRALAVGARIGVLTLLTSLWWIAGLSIQGEYGLDILRFTETVKTVASTSLPGEMLRGLGYWFFYGGDRVQPWNAAARTYMQNVPVIVAGYGLAALGLLGAVVIRWRHRAFFVALVVVGTVIAVGAYPFRSPSPLGALFKSWAGSSKAGLALRSTGRAAPLIVLGLAVLLGAAVDATVRRLRARGRARVAVALPVLVGVVVLASFPPLWNGTFYGSNLERPERIPSYWYDVARAVDAGGTATRVLEAPGADFASYRWGLLVDPVTPGITDRPYVARELVPWGGAAAQNLLDAFDRRLQENVADPRGFADLLRLMSAGAVVLRYDLQHERYNLVRPLELQAMMRAAPGLTGYQAFGGPMRDTPVFPEDDERALSAPPNQAPTPKVALYQVPGARPIVRAESATGALVVAGDGEGLVDASDVGLLTGNRTVLYSGSYDAATLRARSPGAVLVVTDSNRKRAQRWSNVLDVYGLTEQANQVQLATDPGDARLDVFPGAPAAARTVTDQQGVTTVSATGYGNPIAYTPEDRPARALDGDLRTAWKTQAFDNADGQKLRIVTRAPITTDRVRLVQVLEGPRDRYITQVRVRIDGRVVGTYDLGPGSRVAAGQTITFGRRTFRTLELEVANTNVGHAVKLFGGMSAVGFAEVDLRDARGVPVRVDEVVDLPTDLLDKLGTGSQANPLVIVMARDRQLPVPPRYDPELVMSRAFTVPTARTFALGGTARLTSDVRSEALDAILGVPGARRGGVTARTIAFMPGCIRCRASQALDGDPTTAWTTPFAGPRNQWVEYTVPKAVTFGSMDLQVVADGRHSLPKQLVVTAGGQRRVVNLPPVAERTVQDAVTPLRITFPPVTGARIRIAVTDVYERKTTNYFTTNPFLRPVGIAEWGIPGVRAPAPPTAIPPVCRTDLLRVDGRPFPIRLVGSSAAAERLQPLAIRPCDPKDPARVPTISLAPGRHTIESAPGRATGINLDRLLLASAAGGGAQAVAGERVAPFAAQPAPPTVALTRNGRTSLTATVSGARQPFWLVLGESQNKGWRAKVAGGKALGGSTLVDGYANGWYIQPTASSFTVDIEWTPQRRVWFAIMLSIIGAALCLAIVVVGAIRTRRKGPSHRPVRPIEWPVVRTAADDPGGGRRMSAVAIASSAIVSALVAGAVATVPAAVVVAVVVIAVLRWPRRARLPAALLGPAVLGATALYIGSKQLRYRYPSLFEWPTLFGRAYEAAWIALLVVAAVVAADVIRTRGRDAPGDPGDLGDPDTPDVPGAPGAPGAPDPGAGTEPVGAR